MISEYELQSALDDYLNTVATALSLTVRWPGQARQNVRGATDTLQYTPDGPVSWLEPSILTRTNRAISMMRGYEEDGGTYQIAIVCSSLKGPYPLHLIVDQLRPYYRMGSGTTMSPSGKKIIFNRADPRPPFDGGGNIRLPLLVPFSVFALG